MKIVVQRVRKAAVAVAGKEVSAVNGGMLVLVGFEKGDVCEFADYLARKIANLRIFEDAAGKMNLNIKDSKGSLLVVSQFTLAGDLSRGNRPGFETAARPEDAEPLYEYFVECLKNCRFRFKPAFFKLICRSRSSMTDLSLLSWNDIKESYDDTGGRKSNHG